MVLGILTSCKKDKLDFIDKFSFYNGNLPISKIDITEHSITKIDAIFTLNDGTKKIGTFIYKGVNNGYDYSYKLTLDNKTYDCNCVYSASGKDVIVRIVIENTVFLPDNK